MSQRRHYVAYAAVDSGDTKYNYASSLTDERVQKLRELGLDLSTSPPAAPKSEATAAVKVEEDTRDEPSTSLPHVSTPSKRKTEQESEIQHEPRRPPKKRKKVIKAEEQESSSVAEERDAVPRGPDARTSTVERDSSSGERDGVSPVAEKPVKGRGDSAWETLMNVAALVPPLPTATTEASKPAPAIVAASPGSATGSPQPRRVKSKYGDLEALSNAGGSYSSKYRAANNDVVPNQQRWEDMFLRLKTFKDKNGHCRVPNRYPEVSSSLVFTLYITPALSDIHCFFLPFQSGPIPWFVGCYPTKVLQEQEPPHARRSCSSSYCDRL